MNKFKYYFILIITTLSLFSCSKDDNTVESVPLRDFAEQFTADNATIEQYLKTYYIDITDPDFADKDVIIEKITDADTQPSIYSYLNKDTFPKLLSREVKQHDIVYTIYYLVLREGTGDAPCNVDGVLAAYKGQYLTESTVSEVTTLTSTLFEEVKYPQQANKLTGVVQGWSEIFPKFKTGSYTENNDGTVSYSDFGAGVMFLPSGMGYYAQGASSIPSYSPLVFSFKLYAIQRFDQDGDGVPSYLEDINGDGYMSYLATGVENPDDTDGDGIPNYADIDDDGDGYNTKIEIKDPLTGLPYEFDQIPTCTSGVKNFLDATCHP